MNRLKNVLVGVDFSDCSRAALIQAARLAAWNDAQLHVIHILESAVMEEMAGTLKVPVAQLHDIAVERAGESLRGWVRELRLEAEPEFDIGIGSPVEVMLARVRAVHADLLVLGEVGSSPPGAGAGILASKCLRKAPCKVMLVNEHHRQSFRLVLACIDFSETSRLVAAQAVRVASQDRAQLHFPHVFDPPWRRFGYLGLMPEADPGFQQQYRDILRHRLEQFVGDTGGLNVRFDLHETFSTGSGIASFARLLRADLVVLGTRGLTNLKYVLLGSTAERLLRDVPCSILSIKPPEPVGPPPGAGESRQLDRDEIVPVHLVHS